MAAFFCGIIDTSMRWIFRRMDLRVQGHMLHQKN